MSVPRHLTWPIFYAAPDALQMIFNETISSGRHAICKSVLLLTVFYNNLLDVCVFNCLEGLLTLKYFILTRKLCPSTWTFNPNQYPKYCL